MKYCTHCGAEILDEAVICIHCGCSVKTEVPTVPQKRDETLETIVKILLVFGCVSIGWMIFPLAWCIPLTVLVFRRFKNKEEIGTGIKVCVLLFVNLLAGICLLCMED